MNVLDLYAFLLGYRLAFLSFLGTITILFLFKKFVIYRLDSLARKTRISIDDLVIDIIEGINFPYLLIISLFVSSKFMKFSDTVGKAINHIIFAFFLFFIATALQKVVNYFIENLIKTKSRKIESQFDASPFRVLGKVLKGTFWVLAIVIFLQNLGYNISALLAGIGIGGVAIAFALQSILEDVFSYFSIYFDKPFVVGDFLDVGGQFGTVSYIGIKSTRLTTLQGEELIVPNQTLTSSNVHNYKKMKERRIQFSFGILYETPVDKVKKVPLIMKKLIEVEENARFERAHFNNLGDSSLDFEVVYFMLTDDYKEYMDTQQSINLKMIEIFAKEKIEFAYPTRTVLVKNEPKN